MREINLDHSSQNNSFNRAINTSIIVILLLLSLFCISAVSVEAGDGQEVGAEEARVNFWYDADGEHLIIYTDSGDSSPDPTSEPEINEIPSDSPEDDSGNTDGEDIEDPETPGEVDNEDIEDHEGGDIDPGSPSPTTPGENIPPASPFNDEEPEASTSRSSSGSNYDPSEEQESGSDSQTEQEQNQNIEESYKTVIEIDGIECFLFDLDNDQVYDLFVNPETEVITYPEQTDNGEYLIDTNGDGEWNYIYNPSNGAVILINNEQKINEEQSIPAHMMYLLVLISASVISILFYWNYQDQRKMSSTEKPFE